jgi:hypothetical protein
MLHKLLEGIFITYLHTQYTCLALMIHQFPPSNQKVNVGIMLVPQHGSHTTKMLS